MLNKCINPAPKSTAIISQISLDLRYETMQLDQLVSLLSGNLNICSKFETPVTMSHELAEKKTLSQTPQDDKITHFNIDEAPIPGKATVHRVDRNTDEPLPKSGDLIPGYDAELMQARATLSSDEEKKLLRKIDWRLLPLLALMYMLKTIDASNVSVDDFHDCD